MKFVLLVLTLAAQVPLFSQVGYPGGYPPGQSPGQGPGIPWPRRHKADKSKTAAATERRVGRLRKIDDQSIVMVVSDGRVLTYKRTEKTKFFHDAQEIKPADFKAGDQVTVESTEDDSGYLYAVKVDLEPPAPDTEASAQPADTGGRAPGNSTAASEGPEPSPPHLKRGIPTGQSDTDADAGDTSAAADTSSPLRRSQAAEAPPADDPVIEKARQATATFTEKLPNYVCKEYMTRFASSSEPADWKPLDVLSTDIVYEGGRESYRDITVNGKPRKAMDQTGGAYSTGEFGTMLLDLFAPWTAADFHLRRAAWTAGVETKVYDFEVDRAHSHWNVEVASQSIRPAYKGSVWIVPSTGRVLRMELQARGLPQEFPLDAVESAIDYDNVMIGGQKFLLPVHAETLGCIRGTSNCSRNKIDFRNYHKFETSSDVTFAESK